MLVSLLFGADLVAQTFPLGRWYPPYNWNSPSPINTIHVGLIPVGPQRGKVVFLTWDRPSSTSPIGTYWGILDPDLQTPGNPPPASVFTHLAQASVPQWDKATCVGQSWTPDGRWFIAGGQTTGATHNTVQPSQSEFGHNGAWIYDPDVRFFNPAAPAVGQWFEEFPMAVRRYYPTVILSQIDLGLAPLGEMIVAGGSDDWWNGAPWQPPQLLHDNYEVFRPGPRAWPNYIGGTWQTLTIGGQVSRLFPGPTILGPGGASPRFSWYPRLFLLPNGRMACGATTAQSTIATHPTASAASWTNLGVRTQGGLGYGGTVLLPNLSPDLATTVVNFGGAGNQMVEWANLGAGSAGPWPGYNWTADPSPTALPAMIKPRAECNAVILPTGQVLVLGDGGGACRTPEMLSSGTWTLMAEEASVRDHHAVALLLPSGRVLSAGGNERTHDFQVFEPPYMTMKRPAWGAVPGGGILQRGQTYTVPVTLPSGTVAQRVVLMRPGSQTHHADMDQRYVSLELATHVAGSVAFHAPVGPPGPGGGVRAPLGYYMIFVVNDAGVPSTAEFVRFQ